MYENELSVRFVWQTMADRWWLRRSLSFLSVFIIFLLYAFSLLILLSITSWLICFRLLRQNTAKLRLCGWGKQHFNNWDQNVYFHPNVSVNIAQPVLPHFPARFDIVTLMDVAVVKLTMKLVYRLNPWLFVYDINTSSKTLQMTACSRIKKMQSFTAADLIHGFKVWWLKKKRPQRGRLFTCTPARLLTYQ